MTAPLDPHNPGGDRDFRQLTDAFDRPIAPSPSFADALKQRLKEESAMHHAPTATGTVPSTPISNRTARTTAQRIPKRRWLDIAIAAAVIIGMLATTFWYADVRTGDDGPGDPEATRYAAQPLSAASTPEAEGATTSDPRSTLSYPAGFDPSAEHAVVPLGDEGPSAPELAAISGNILIVSGSTPEWASLGKGLTAIDLTTGKVIWASETAPLREFIVVNGTIYGGFKLAPEYQSVDSAEFRMMAFDALTGESVWTGPELLETNNSGLDVVSPAVSFNVFRPTVIDGMLYYVDRTGSVIALDVATGAEEWSMPLAHESNEPEWNRGGSVVGDKEYLYVVDGQNTIRKLSSLTGEEVDRFPLTDRPSAAYLVELHLQDNTLFAISRSVDVEGSTAFTDGISTEDGEILWSQRLGSVGPFLTMTDDVVAIPHQVFETEIGAVSSDINEAGLYVSILDIKTGDPVSLYGPSTAEMATVSSSGSVVCINEATLISCVDTASDTRTLVQLPYAPGGESFAPLLFWNETAIVLDVDVGVTLLQPKDTQSQSASGPMLPGDPGHTSAWPEVFDISGPIAAQELDGYQSYGASATIIEDVLIAENKRLAHEDSATFSGTGIYAQDLTTGDVLWRHTGQVHQRYTADASGVYILPQSTAGGQRLIALDLRTGEQRWSSDHLATFSSFPDADGFLHAGTPVAIGGIAYAPFVDGSVVAFDGATGDIAWHYAPAAANITNGDVSIAGDADRIYAAAGDNVISVLDRHDGSLIRSIAPEDIPADEYSVALHVRDGRLVVQARAKASDGPGGILVAIDSDSGDQLWRQETGVIGSSNVLVTETAIGVVHTTFDDPSLIERILPNQPIEGTASFSIFDLETGEPIEMPEGVFTPIDGVWTGALASSGETVCLFYTTVTCFDSAGNIVTVDGYETPHLTTIGQELLFWDNRLVIVSPLEPTHTAGPATSPVATPQASPAVSNVERDAEAALLTNDPGNTNAYPAGYDPALTGPVEQLEVARVAPESAVIAGDTLVISGQVLKNADAADALTYGTQAIDLTNGEELWLVDTGLTGDLVVDEWNVYGYQIDTVNAFTSSKLVSLSLDSGNMNWMIQTLTATPDGNVAPNHHRLIMIGSHLYVPFTNGSVIAYDQGGNVVWEHETGEPLPEFREFDWSPVAGDENAIYIAGESGEITKLDRLTGEPIDTFTVAAGVPTTVEASSSMDLHIQGDTLVAVVHPPAPLEPDDTETIVALSTHGSDVKWVQEVTYQTGNLVLTETVVGVPQYVFGEGPTEQKITFYNLATGEVLHESEIIATANPVLSASGEAICLYTTRIECGSFDGLERVVTGIGFSNSLSKNPPIMYWNGQLVILDILTGVYITQPAP